jgi:hypothetical protein
MGLVGLKGPKGDMGDVGVERFYCLDFEPNRRDRTEQANALA